MLAAPAVCANPPNTGIFLTRACVCVCLCVFCVQTLRVEWRQEGTPRASRSHSLPVSAHKAALQAAADASLQRHHSAVSPHGFPPHINPELLSRTMSLPHAATPQQPAFAWQGILSKSGVQQCRIGCAPLDPSPQQGATEPRSWPDTIDVRQRVEIQTVLGKVWQSNAPQVRAARLLLPVPGDKHSNRVGEFAKYLAEKVRAGVVSLEGGRTLYLMPAEQSYAQVLSLPWDPNTDPAALFAVVVPSSSSKV